MSPEEITFFKDVIYPSADIALKIVAGIFLLVYLHNKSHRGGLREKMCEVYFSIIEGHDALYYHCSKEPFLKVFGNAPFSLDSNEAYDAYHEAVNECIGHKYISQADAFDALRKVSLEHRKLYFLLRKKEYSAYFSDMRKDVEDYYFEQPQIPEIQNSLSTNIDETNNKIKELATHFKNKIITQGEFKLKIIDLLLPICGEISSKSSEKFNNKIRKHSEKMVQYINWYG